MVRWKTPAEAAEEAAKDERSGNMGGRRRTAERMMAAQRRGDRGDWRDKHDGSTWKRAAERGRRGKGCRLTYPFPSPPW